MKVLSLKELESLHEVKYWHADHLPFITRVGYEPDEKARGLVPIYYELMAARNGNPKKMEGTESK